MTPHAHRKNEGQCRNSRPSNPSYLEIVTLGEVNQTEKEKYHDTPYMWNLKINDASELTYKTKRDSQT